MNKKYSIHLMLLNALLVLFASICMYNGYKCLSGFVANGFRDGMTVLVMTTSYWLIPISYLYFFYAFYVKKTNKYVSVVVSTIIAIWNVFNLVNISSNMSIYISNASISGYDTLLLSIGIFPFDMIITNVVILILQLCNICNTFKSIKMYDTIKNKIIRTGTFRFNIIEYLIYCILMVVGFIFIGDFVMSFSAIGNIAYDVKYLFLMLYVLCVPLTLIGMCFLKLDELIKNKKGKIIYLSSLIFINVLFTSLLFILEAIYPDFIIRIGKPFFVITFSVSLPIEIIMLISISLGVTITGIIRIITTCIKEK